MYTKMLSGGGSKMASDTLVTTTATGHEYTIETGISNIKNFIIHGYSANSTYGASMQHILRWDAERDTGKYYSMFHYSNASGANYIAFSSTAQQRNFVMVSVNAETGVVKIKSPTTSSWANTNFLWVAW